MEYAVYRGRKYPLFSKSKALWTEVEAALYSREFEAALWAKLLIKPPWKFRDFRVQTDGAGFNVGAHPDISKKLATMMFYLPTGDEVCSARTEDDADFEAWPIVRGAFPVAACSIRNFHIDVPASSTVVYIADLTTPCTPGAAEGAGEELRHVPAHDPPVRNQERPRRLSGVRGEIPLRAQRRVQLHREQALVPFSVVWRVG